jgi:hypothetical protein
MIRGNDLLKNRVAPGPRNHAGAEEPPVGGVLRAPHAAQAWGVHSFYHIWTVIVDRYFKFQLIDLKAQPEDHLDVEVTLRGG